MEAFDGSGPAEHAIGRCRSARGLPCSSPRVPRGLGWSPTSRDGPRAPLGAREWLPEPSGADNLDFGPSFNIFLGFGLFKKKQNYIVLYKLNQAETLASAARESECGARKNAFAPTRKKSGAKSRTESCAGRWPRPARGPNEHRRRRSRGISASLPMLRQGQARGRMGSPLDSEAFAKSHRSIGPAESSRRLPPS